MSRRRDGSDPEAAERLRAKAETFPHRPGVYLWKDAKGQVLYVGKSVDLKARVLSYFGASASEPDKASRLVARARDLDFFVTDGEADALILEYRLIQRHRPRFNVAFRDDKSYPMIKITAEEWPRILVTRRRLDDGATYLGPYPSAASVRRTLKLITGLFPIRDCSFPSARLQKANLCLSYHVGRCAGPCEGKVDGTDYRELAAHAARFLRGDVEPVLRDLENRMAEAAGRMEFERAALFRDRIAGLRRLSEPSRVQSAGAPFDEDVVAADRRGSTTCIQEIQYRKGRMEASSREMVTTDEPLPEVLAAFLATRYLGDGARVPGAVLVSHPPRDQGALEEAIRKASGRAVSILVPERGRRHELVQMALRNAASYLESQGGQGPGEAAVERLREVLGLEEAPARIEGFDISNLGETEKVASLVVALDGRMARSEYRRFVVRTVEGQDDFACMAEVVGRRYRRVLDEGLPLPDLVMVDGGPGQVAAAHRVLVEELGLGDLPLVGLAKREERIHRPGDREGELLAPDDPARLLLQAIRDEAHRFALAHHRIRRERRSLQSGLDGIPGIGPGSRKVLLRHFRDLEAVRRASLEELLAVEGLTRRAALALFGYYHPAGSGTVSAMPKE